MISQSKPSPQTHPAFEEIAVDFPKPTVSRHFYSIASPPRPSGTGFAHQKLSPRRIDYDSFVTELQRTTKKVVRHMGIPTAPISPIGLPHIQPQSDGLNAEWAKRFKLKSATGAGGRA